MARILAIDYGRKRTGIAVTDPLGIIANGLTTTASHETIAFLKNYFEKEQVEKIILGLPKQVNNTDSENASFVKAFRAKLKKAFPGIPIEYMDERFTSKIAFQTMIDAGLGKKARQNKALIDTISATLILQTYLEQQSNFNNHHDITH